MLKTKNNMFRNNILLNKYTTSLRITLIMKHIIPFVFIFLSTLTFRPSGPKSQYD